MAVQLTLPGLGTPDSQRIDKNLNANSLQISQTMFSIEGTLMSILQVMEEQLQISKEEIAPAVQETIHDRVSETRDRVERSRELERERERQRLERNERVQTTHERGINGSTLMGLIDAFGTRFLTSTRVLGALGVGVIATEFEKVEPIIIAFIEAIGKLVKILAKMTKPVLPVLIENLSTVLLSFIGIIATVKAIKLVAWIGKTKTALAALGLTFSTLFLGVTGIAAVVFSIVESIEAFKEAGGGLEGLKAAAHKFAETLLITIPNFLLDLLGSLVNMFGFEELAEKIQNIDVRSIVEFDIAAFLLELGDIISNKVTQLFDHIADFMSDIFNFIPNLISDKFRDFKAFMFGERTENLAGQAETPEEEREFRIARIQEEIQMLQSDLDEEDNTVRAADIFRRMINKQNELAEEIRERDRIIEQLNSTRQSLPSFENFARGVPARASSGGLTGLDIAQRSQLVNETRNTVQNVIAPATQITDASVSTSIAHQNFIGSSPTRQRRSPQQQDFVQN